MKSKSQILIVVLVVGLLVCFTLLFIKGTKKEGYVDVVQLHEQFELRLALQNELDTELSLDQNRIEEIRSQIQQVYDNSSLHGDARFGKIRKLQSALDSTMYLLNGKEQELTAKYNEQIWSQLNTYLRQYGEENDIDMLHGANGQGNILYGSDQYDLTKDCIQFVNKKYRGE